MGDWIECDECTNGERYRETYCDGQVCPADDFRYVKETEDCHRWNKNTCPCQ